jgi:glycosyltransferase involved in cell wall biosynthesis
LGDGTRVVVTACRLVEYKGMLRFLEAARVCGAEDTVFLVAGEGPLRGEMEAYISEHSLGKKVKLLGYMGCMEDLYSICDAVVLCSDSEGQPYLLLEAMRAGRPVVATDVAGNRELLEEGCGALVEASAEAVARGIASVLADRLRAEECAENGRRRFLANHLLERQVSELVDTYRGCLVDAEEGYAGDRVAAS